MLHALVHAADILDRDGGALVMATLFGLFPFLGKLYADGGYQGAKFQTAVKRAINQLNVEIVKRSDAARGFLVLPKRAALIFTLTEADGIQRPKVKITPVLKTQLSCWNIAIVSERQVSR